ncbi:hypothetical protein [Streptomyces sp. NEAU-W12]|uniref:hypothetical protein n=1 Tax=Streptomyces sp. NEAU-W12 TaxID=2994668 RepID=UPI00224A8327|nr:hypothetical protein [Streptomyces sp. NEAU-W12]MCX2927280.1 hypothetical protein [Streptomyces sp. NEAU-W12]
MSLSAASTDDWAQGPQTRHCQGQSHGGPPRSQGAFTGGRCTRGHGNGALPSQDPLHHSAARHPPKRVGRKRFKAYTYEEPIARDKADLDITRLRDPGLDDADNLPASEVLAAEIVENLQAVLEEFAAIAETLQQARGEGPAAEAAPTAD